MSYDVETHFYIFTCRYCQQTFKTRFGLKRYCSDLCYNQAHPRKPRIDLWTHQEDRTLRQLAGEVAPHIIAERLGRRSTAAVKTRARYLKINLVLYGERHPDAKYSDAQVEQVRTLYDEGLKARAIASRLGIPLSTVEKYVYYQDRLGPPIERYF
jgi:hypothetical protein